MARTISANSRRAAHDAGKAGAGQLAALLLVSLVLKEDRADWRGPTCFAHLLGNPGLRAAVKDPKLGEPLGRLLLAWAERQAVAEVASLQYFLYFVDAAEWREGLPAVRRLIRDKGAAGFNLRGPAVAVLGKVGGRNAAAELEKLWGDATLLSPLAGLPRLGDQALAASIRLAGAAPKDYGLRPVYYDLRGPGRVWTVVLYGFDSDSARQAALKKWKAKK